MDYDKLLEEIRNEWQKTAIIGVGDAGIKAINVFPLDKFKDRKWLIKPWSDDNATQDEPLISTLKSSELLFVVADVENDKDFKECINIAKYHEKEEKIMMICITCSKPNCDNAIGLGNYYDEVIFTDSQPEKMIKPIEMLIRDMYPIESGSGMIGIDAEDIFSHLIHTQHMFLINKSFSGIDDFKLNFDTLRNGIIKSTGMSNLEVVVAVYIYEKNSFFVMNQMGAVIHAMFDDDCDISFQALPERQEGENIEVSILYGKAKNQEDKYV